MRIAINGMGRIGRLLCRRLLQQDDFELVAVNDIMDTNNLLYLLKYDSLYGPFPGDLSLHNGVISSGDKQVRALQFNHPSQVAWRDLGVDLVIECSGHFTSKESASTHLAAGAKKVLLSTTGSANIPLMIYGHNHQDLTKDFDIISPGGCMTNCSTNILHLLNEAYGVESAQLNVLHSYTSRQQLVDTWHKQYRRGRAGAESIIPFEVDLAQSLERLLPLEGKIATMSTRVPVTNGALADCTIQLKNDCNPDDINKLFLEASLNDYKNVIGYTEDPIVSADIKGSRFSCIIDGTLTSIVGRQVKIIAWFDNEFGYTSRMLDWLHHIRAVNAI